MTQIDHRPAEPPPRTASARRSRAPAGAAFTLLEVLVAGVVLATGAVMVLEAITSTQAASSRAARRAAALHLAAGRTRPVRGGPDHRPARRGRRHGRRGDLPLAARAGHAEEPLARVTCRVKWDLQAAAYPVSVERIVSSVRETPP